MSRDVPTPADLAFGPFVIDRIGGRLFQGGVAVDIAPKPAAVLVYLAERPGRLVSKDELLDAVWGHRHVSDSVLKVTVNALRQALGDDARSPQWLHTVPRRGYRFSDAVQEAPRADRGSPAVTTVSPPVVPPPVTQPVRHGATPADVPADVPANLPAATSSQRGVDAPAPIGNLPPGRPRLVGRDEDEVAVHAAMREHRLVTITGPGGVGKTSLALQAAPRDPPVDGVWLLRLEPFSSAEAVTAALARTVGLSDAAGSSVQAMARALSPLRLRLVLDNAEHLVDQIAEPLSAWLLASPGLRLLVTSQRPLNIAGEQRLPLRPLPVGPAVHAAGGVVDEGMADSPAVSLLLQRVLAHEPTWSPQASDRADAAAIARALDGLPLALELAAVRVPVLGMAGVRQRLDARLRLLTQGRADAPDRHRTLRAALSWSIGLLPPVAAAVLDRLSVLSTSFTLDAARAVAAPADSGLDDIDFLDAIGLLRDMALVVPAEAAPSPGGPRLRLYDSVRLLALERLAARGEEDRTRHRLRAWLLELYGGAFERLVSESQTHWLARQVPEAEHLQNAMTQGLEACQGTASPALLAELAELGGVSAAFCCRAGLKHLSAGWLAALRRMGADDEAQPGHARRSVDIHTAVLTSLGLLGSPTEGLAAGERSWVWLQQQGRPGASAYVLNLVAHLSLRLQRPERVAEVTALLRGLLPPEANVYQRRQVGWLEAIVLRGRGDFEAYVRFCAEVYEESRERGDQPESWVAAMGWGQALYLLGRGEEAVTVLDRAVDEVRACGRLRVQGPLVAQAAVMRVAHSGDPQTVQRLREAVRVLQPEGLVWWLADALSWVPMWQGRLEDARRVQAWADGWLAARGESRGPVFRRLRAAFAERIGDDRAPDAPPLDEPAALRLALGPEPGPAA